MSERTWEERQVAKKLREFVDGLTEPGPKYTYRREELGWLESLACHLESDEDALKRMNVGRLVGL
jgi:hypothetical protein